MHLKLLIDLCSLKFFKYFLKWQTGKNSLFYYTVLIKQKLRTVTLDRKLIVSACVHVYRSLCTHTRTLQFLRFNGDIRGPFHLFWELDVSLCLALPFHTFRVSWLSVRPFVFLIFGLQILTVFYTMFVHPTLPSVVFPSGHPLQFITQNI